MKSFWENTVTMPKFRHQEGDIRTDVLIIGGGMAGVLCAYMLRQAGVDCVLVEAKTVGSGMTGNTTAKITAQHGLIYGSLIQRFGTEKAGLYLRANLEALDAFSRLAGRYPCNFEEKDAFVYSQDDRRKIEQEIAALEKLGYTAEFSQAPRLPFPVAGAVKFERQAQFHPMRFLAAISADLPILEHTAVRELVGTTALTDYGEIRAKKIIVTTHFPFLNKHGSYFLKLYQDRSYVIALENAADLGGMYVDGAATGLSFRNYGGLLLLGGGSHRTGKQGGNWRVLREAAGRYYPNATEKYHWAAQDCMPLDGIPYIGPYSARTENLYVATGFHKWGMTSSVVSARLLTDAVLERRNPLADVFSPSRTILRPQLAVNAWEAVTGLLTPSRRRCPHLGCALKWNRTEHTWDCSCHGSRFTGEGKLIDNPATGDLKPKKKVP